ncbi:hypothetical protein Q6348_14320 [Isoptericola sp. b441]|uniref:Uncharacterized protein n=1 Tax=Actinotalea lenta TaxID=3064654 RepID=A0ABT9DCQ1_9CELL|nr:hypothetical protein [Isoptericola sp. b441]MDO8108370.1 hypothetical protein [Isoptericola sp. b441]
MLRHLEAVGFDGAPRFLGVGARGRLLADAYGLDVGLRTHVVPTSNALVHAR